MTASRIKYPLGSLFVCLLLPVAARASLIADAYGTVGGADTCFDQKTSSANCSFTSPNASYTAQATAFYQQVSSMSTANSLLPAIEVIARSVAQADDVITLYGGNGAVYVITDLAIQGPSGTGSGRSVFQYGKNIPEPSPEVVSMVAWQVPTGFLMSVSTYVAATQNATRETASLTLIDLRLSAQPPDCSSGTCMFTPLDGYTYTTASGSLYPFEGGTFQQTPETASWILMACGVGLLVFGMLLRAGRKPQSN